MPLLRLIYSGLSCFFFVSCVSQQPELYINPHTLGGTAVLPQTEIAAFFGPKEWQSVRVQDYKGYVIMDGLIDSSGKVRSLRIVQNAPDASRDQLARELAKEIRLFSNRSDSAIDPPATVYMIFYEFPRGNQALVYAKRSDPFDASDFHSGMVSGSPGNGKYCKFLKY